MSNRFGQVTAAILFVAAVFGCKSSGNKNMTTSTNSNRTSSSNTSTTDSGKPDDQGIIHSGTGEEKEKPAAGKSNVQGKVLFNSQPAPNIEVKLCERFNQYFGGCQGQTYSTKTDAGGEYLIRNVPPGLYEGLIARVFNTPYYVFATSGFITSAKYQLDADRTFFAPDSHLFKSDLRIVSPKAGAKIDPDNVEVKWESYSDAAYYKLSIYADTSTGAEANYDYINKRIDGTSDTVDKPLKPGSYRVVVNAYNSSDVKIAESPDDIKFTVK